MFLSTEEFWKFVTDQRFLGQLQNEQMHPPMKKHEVVDLIQKLEPTRPRTGGAGVCMHISVVQSFTAQYMYRCHVQVRYWMDLKFCGIKLGGLPYGLLQLEGLSFHCFLGFG